MSRGTGSIVVGRRACLCGVAMAIACSRSESAAGSGPPPIPSSPNVRLLTWDLGVQPWGPARAVVVVPAWGDAGARYPVLIALHGHGEAIKAPAEGAMGWPRDYALVRAVDRLRAPPLREADYEGFVDPARMADANASLAARPFGGLIVVCPWMPDFHPATTADLGAYQRFLLETLLPRVKAQVRRPTASPEATGIDGVSLGGVVALRIGLTTPSAFGAVGGIQPGAPTGARQRMDGGGEGGAREPAGASQASPARDEPTTTSATRSTECRARGAPTASSTRTSPRYWARTTAFLNCGPGSIELLLRARPVASRGRDRAERVPFGAPAATIRGMSAWLVPLEVLAQRRGGDDPRVVGGKAARLAWLVRHHFDVPDALVLPAEAFTQATRDLSPSWHPRALLRASTGRAGYTRAAEARKHIESAPRYREVSKTSFAPCGATWASVAHGASPCARAATCEDGALVSMAGLADTILGVRGGDELAAAVRRVWASIANGRALAYLAAHGVRDVGMAVILQRVVEAKAGGVMFTRAPDGRARGVEDERIVNVGFGLGAPVVNGVTSPDVLRIDARGRLVGSLIAHKARSTVVGDAGVAEVSVDDPDRPALSRERLADLADIAARLERLEAVAWDVEFACDADRTWVVQARLGDGVKRFPDGGDAETVWSNVNVGEALPGVATPFTWSIAGAFSEAGFRRAFAALGCRVPKNCRLVGNVHGRVFLNLTQFMRIAAQVPFLDPRTLVELGGGWGGEELATQVEGVSRRSFYLRLPLTASRLLREQIRSDDDGKAFEVLAEKEWRAQSALGTSRSSRTTASRAGSATSRGSSSAPAP